MANTTELIVTISTPRIRLLHGYTLVHRGLCHPQAWGGLMLETTIWVVAHHKPLSPFFSVQSSTTVAPSPYPSNADRRSCTRASTVALSQQHPPSQSNPCQRRRTLV
ncbi:hypothetical protein PIB30_092143, partial [Stylosanthes scabra]|nr:hypothetical protein [Stylosanthes scabra]